jgi:hypothetical protein
MRDSTAATSNIQDTVATPSNLFGKECQACCQLPQLLSHPNLGFSFTRLMDARCAWQERAAEEAKKTYAKLRQVGDTTPRTQARSDTVRDS